MKMKKVLAVVMAFCMVAGAVSYGVPFISQAITAQADVIEGSCYSFDEETGVLTLRGTVDRGALVEFSDNCKDLVKSVVVEKGTVFPKDSSELFKGYKNCTTIDLSNANTSNVFFMQSMFMQCVSLKSIDLSGFDTSKVTCMSSMFEHCESLESIDLSGFDTSSVVLMPFMFEGCESLVTLDLSGFDTRNVTEMSYLFSHCSSLTKLDLSGFDTGKVIHMSGMFSFSQHLTELDVSGFDTKNVTSMSSMFAGCSLLSELDVSGFDTCSLVYASSMFFGCSGLTSLDVSCFDTSKVMYMAAMFYGCSGLTSLDVSGFDTGNVTTMNSMFFGCSELTSLDISNFDTSKVTYMDDMFTDCNNLKTLKIGKNFNNIKADAKLPNGEGWVNANAPTTVISGDGEYAVIKNSGKNTYKRLPITILTYPTNIKVEYNEKYQQVRFKWDKVEDADRYGIAVYLAGKWKVQMQTTDTFYTSPKNLTPGRTYSVAIAARVNSKWDIANATKNAVIIVRIPDDPHVYDECIEKIKCMEKYISDYWYENKSSRNDYMTVCMNLIRIQNPNYNSWKWDFTTGETNIDADLKIMEYINEKDKSCLEYFKNMKEHPFYDDYGNEIDFLHLIATLQGQYNECISQIAIDKDLSGWLGDLQSLVYDLKKETYGKNVDLKSKALELIAHDGTHFSAEDMYADIDAKNISCLYKTNYKLSGVIEDYYKNHSSKRFSLFVEESGGIGAIENKAEKYTSQSIDPSHSILTNAAERITEDSNLDDVYFNTYITDEYGNATYILNLPNIVSKDETEALTYAFVTYIKNEKNSED